VNIGVQICNPKFSSKLSPWDLVNCCLCFCEISLFGSFSPINVCYESITDCFFTCFRQVYACLPSLCRQVLCKAKMKYHMKLRTDLVLPKRQILILPRTPKTQKNADSDSNCKVLKTKKLLKYHISDVESTLCRPQTKKKIPIFFQYATCLSI